MVGWFNQKLTSIISSCVIHLVNLLLCIEMWVASDWTSDVLEELGIAGLVVSLFGILREKESKISEHHMPMDHYVAVKNFWS